LNEYQDEQQITYQSLYAALAVGVRWSWLVVLAAGIGIFIAWYATRPGDPEYAARSTIIVDQGRGLASGSNPDIQTSEQLARTYERLIVTRPILEAAATDLAPGPSAAELAGMIRVKAVDRTQFLEITGRSGDAEEAARVANGVALSFIRVTIESRLIEIARLEQLARSSGIESAVQIAGNQLASLESLSIVEPAVVPSSPITENRTLNMLAGGFLGALAGILVAASAHLYRDRLSGVSAIERRVGVQVLGEIPLSDEEAMQLGSADPHSFFTEAVRFLHANIRLARDAGEHTVIAVSSPNVGAGKTTVALGLARIAAEAGKSVVLVDADMRIPFLSSSLFKGEINVPGLSNYLSGAEDSLGGIIRQSQFPRLQVVPSGPTPPNPSELLSTPRLERIIDDLRTSADLVVVDTPPYLVVSDTAYLLRQMDAVLIVANQTSTKQRALVRTIDSIKRLGVPVKGVVVNQIKSGWLTGYYGEDYWSGTGYRYYSNGAAAGQTAASSPNGHSPGWVKQGKGLISRLKDRV
jgi:tyrosine-protein kinase Etk/Wzc